MSGATALDRGRRSFAEGAWGEAYARLSAASLERSLDPRDLEQLALAARLVGREAESGELLTRAHQAYLASGEEARAARCAVWLAIRLVLDGELAQAGGWIARARRLLETVGMDCVETGYVLLPIGIRAALQGDTAASCAAFAEAAAIGERFGERDLVTLARQGQGRALIRMGQVDRGVALLDEVMVAVTAGELSASVVGDVYCSVIDACHELYDLRRAHEWTAALTRWCADQPEVAPYRGQCMLHRAEILQLHGDWMDALDEAERARERLSQPPPRRSVGAAFYRLGELHRLRGQLDQAEALYRQGSELGRDPHPGLALLRLAQGKIEAAAASSRRVVAEGRNPRTRAAELGAHVDIMLAAGDVAAARAAAEELGTIAARLSSPYLQATASQALGAVLLAEEDARSALASLRRAATGWLELGAPYERARVHALIGLAHRALGDGDTAAMELDAAAKALRALGATPDANRVDALARTDSAGKGAEPLTAREVQVIQLVATGRTNRAIAEALGISEKTVARHLSNIFTKLGLSSRAAATAYAYQHRLLRPPT